MITIEEANILSVFNLFPKVKVKYPNFVFRSLAPVGYTLHVDGASKGNPGNCGEGGCIRDSDGNFFAGFAFAYGKGDKMLRHVLVSGWDKFGPPAKQSMTGERLAAVIFGNVGLEACVLTWFWHVEAAWSVENTDRASFYEFFLLCGIAICRVVAFVTRQCPSSRSVTTREPDPRPMPRTRFSRSPPTDPGDPEGL
ncbi:hypothetical protein Taro_046923 [Colocasia esculenta]|uniref:RNase H type-1 domain-containing protein n=1 Tax=Colocasia esculenta TaxID=4460 RepID=A0A843X648_COLES|nr:hypothetical protein [Colocasia esculenta]